jgi:hypothetical protein
LVDLKKLLVPRRRRRAPRPDGPKTIVPPRPEGAADRFDAARERLRREIPPRVDED